MILKIKDNRQIDFYIDEYLFSVDGDLPEYSDDMRETRKLVDWFEKNSEQEQFEQFMIGMSTAASIYWRDSGFCAIICVYILSIKCDITIEKENDYEATRTKIPKVI